MARHLPLLLSLVLVSTLAAGCTSSPRRMMEEYLEGRQAGDSNSETSPSEVDSCEAGMEVWLDETGLVDGYRSGSMSSQILASFAIRGSRIDLLELPPVTSKFDSWQQDESLHQQTWDQVVAVIPTTYRAGVTRFVLFSDGPAGALGAVEQPDQPGEWTLAVDLLDAQELPTLAATLIHETAHLLSLGPSQVEPYLPLFEHPEDETLFTLGDAACSTYFVLEGCSQPDSYLNQFFTQFWAGIYTEWMQTRLGKDDNARSRLLVKFHARHADEFVSSYAATSPEEDLAETFLHFVLSTEPAGESRAGDKTRFFQQFPGLVDLRLQMRRSLCSLWEP